MLIITITEVKFEDVTTDVNVVKCEEPTEYFDTDSSGKQTRIYKREHHLQPYNRREKREIVLLKQEIEDDSNFDLPKVIAAINNIEPISPNAE